jgi:hypothetical protein
LVADRLSTRRWCWVQPAAQAANDSSDLRTRAHAELKALTGSIWDDAGMGGQAGKGLRAAVVRLAWAGDAQIEYLHDIGVGGLADELALEFDDRFAVHRACPDSLGPAGGVLADLDRALERMSGEANAHLWTDQALSSASEWHEVRALATLALTVLPDA